MNTKLRLFLAGALGALVGGSLVHHFLHGYSEFTITAVTVIGVAVSAYLASFVYDPSETWSVTKNAFTKGDFDLIAFLGELASTLKMILTIFGCVALMFGLPATLVVSSWYGAIWLMYFSNPIALYPTIDLLSIDAIMCIVFAGFLCDSGLLAKGSFTDCLKFNLRRAYVISPLGAIQYTAKGLAWVLCHISQVALALAYFLLYLGDGLTRCKLRSTAMTGASLGTVSGLFLNNPLAYAFIGGVSALTIHLASVSFRENIANLLSAVRLKLTNHYSDVEI